MSHLKVADPANRHRLSISAFEEQWKSVEVVQAFLCLVYWKEPDDTVSVAASLSQANMLTLSACPSRACSPAHLAICGICELLIRVRYPRVLTIRLRM